MNQKMVQVMTARTVSKRSDIFHCHTKVLLLASITLDQDLIFINHFNRTFVVFERIIKFPDYWITFFKGQSILNILFT